MLETCRGPWFLINWIKSASCWFQYTDILWCTVNKTLSLNYKDVLCTTQKGEDLISRVAEAWNLPYCTPFRSIALWSCCMSVSDIFNLAQICVLFDSSVPCPRHILSQYCQYLNERPVAGDCCQHESPEDRGKIYMACHYYVYCPLASVNFPNTGIDCLYVDVYYFGLTCYCRIIIWFSLKLWC
jgi:hypothetical protein